MRRIVLLVLFMLFLGGCASPGSLRRDGAACIFTVAKGTPAEFSRCLVGQLDERICCFNPILRDNIDGNATILLQAGANEVRYMFDINKEDNGLNILLYFHFNSDCRDIALYLPFKQALDACGAKEKALPERL